MGTTLRRATQIVATTHKASFNRFLGKRLGALPTGRDRVHAPQASPEERPGLGRAEERRHCAPDDWLRKASGRGGRQGVDPAVCRLADVRELQPTVLQTRLQDPRGISSFEALPHACHAIRAPDDSGVLPEAVKGQMSTMAASLDPLRLLEEIRTIQAHLAKIKAGESPKSCPTRMPTWGSSSEASPWPGRVARSGQHIDPRRSQSGTGGHGRIRLKPPGQRYPRGWRRSQTAKPRTCSRECKPRTLASSQMGNCGRSSGGSRSGGVPEPGALCSGRSRSSEVLPSGALPPNPGGLTP